MTANPRCSAGEWPAVRVDDDVSPKWLSFNLLTVTNTSLQPRTIATQATKSNLKPRIANANHRKRIVYAVDFMGRDARSKCEMWAYDFLFSCKSYVGYRLRWPSRKNLSTPVQLANLTSVRVGTEISWKTLLLQHTWCKTMSKHGVNRSTLIVSPFVGPYHESLPPVLYTVAENLSTGWPKKYFYGHYVITYYGNYGH